MDYLLFSSGPQDASPFAPDTRCAINHHLPEWIGTMPLDRDTYQPPDLGEDLCVCFHVPWHKIVKHIRLNNPRVASQCSECYGAGTGCGWCIPFIEQIFERMKSGENAPDVEMDWEEYRKRRMEYLKKIKAK